MGGVWELAKGGGTGAGNGRGYGSFQREEGTGAGKGSGYGEYGSPYPFTLRAPVPPPFGSSCSYPLHLPKEVGYGSWQWEGVWELGGEGVRELTKGGGTGADKGRGYGS